MALLTKRERESDEVSSGGGKGKEAKKCLQGLLDVRLVVLDWVGFVWIGLDWIGLNWFGFGI